MRKWILPALLICTAVLSAQKLPPPDHTKANIDGMQGVMFASATRNAQGEWEPAEVSGCRAYLAPGNAPHEHLVFPCNEWFVTPAEGPYLAWLTSEKLVSSSQSVLMAREVPYGGFGLVAVHDMEPAGFVTIDVPVPADHTVRFMHLDAPGTGFILRVSARDAAKKLPMPPGRVVAGIFDSRDEAVAHHRPLHVKAGETTTFRIVRPERGSDLVVVLSRPAGHREGTPLEIVLKGNLRKTPDVFSDRHGRYVVAVWYGLTDESVTVSATSPTLEVERKVKLHPQTVSTVRAELGIKEGTPK